MLIVIASPVIVSCLQKKMEAMQCFEHSNARNRSLQNNLKASRLMKFVSHHCWMGMGVNNTGYISKFFS
jgi:hypothetical protein